AAARSRSARACSRSRSRRSRRRGLVWRANPRGSTALTTAIATRPITTHRSFASVVVTFSTLKPEPVGVRSASGASVASPPPSSPAEVWAKTPPCAAPAPSIAAAAGTAAAAPMVVTATTAAASGAMTRRTLDAGRGAPPVPTRLLTARPVGRQILLPCTAPPVSPSVHATAGDGRSPLVLRARVRGAAADQAALERRPVAGASSTLHAVRLQVAGVGPASPAELVERLVDRIVQRAQLIGVERSRGPGRVEARAPQRLVGEQVAEPGKARLVHQPRLQRGGRSVEQGGELLRGHGHRVDTEPRLVRVEEHAAKSPWIADRQRAAVREREPEPLPRGIVTRR